MFDRYQNVEFNHCYTMGQRINFNWNGSISLCHGIEVGDFIIGDIKEKTVGPEWYEKKIADILEKCRSNDDSLICKMCSNYRSSRFEADKIKVVTINTASLCNCKCIYCGTWSMRSNKMYDPLPYIQRFVEGGVISSDCFFDWGGGEPILNEYFERTFRYIEDKGYIQRVNTNALKFSPFLMDAMGRGKCLLRTSLDAGDQETFFYVKGSDCFATVCDNIEKYAKGNEERVTIKYVLNSANRSHSSIKGFIRFCQDIHINNIVLDADLNSYASKNYHGPLFFTEDELEAARYFVSYAHMQGIEVEIGYIYTAGTKIESRDYNSIDGKTKCKYTIPTVLPKYMDDKVTLSGQIKSKSFASLDALKKFTDRPVIIYLDGMVGNIERKMIKDHKIKIARTFKATDDLKKIKKIMLIAVKNKMPIIVCSIHYEKILHLFNQAADVSVENSKLNIVMMDEYRFIDRKKSPFFYWMARILKKIDQQIK